MRSRIALPMALTKRAQRSRHLILALVLAGAHIVALQPHGALELKEYESMRSPASSTAEYAGQLARVNFMRDEPGPPRFL